MPQVVEVRFKGNRKAFFEWLEPEPLREREPVLVETDRGMDLGHVGAVGKLAELKCERCTGCAVGGPAPSRGPEGGAGDIAATVVVESADADGADEAPPPPRPDGMRRVVRRASPADVRVADDLRRNEDDVRRRIREKVSAHGLVMKVSDAEWQWDRRKLSVYFTADKRVDFRNLVRDLASLFRTRIELRQIGVRDEAVRLDGIGRCGRRLCSASFLTEMRPIGLQIAKDQRLSLNPVQISGPCGRLLCCLRFEHDFYVQSRKRFPKEHKTLQTSRGAEKVVAVNIFSDLVTLRGEDGIGRTVPLAELRAEMEGGPPAPVVATGATEATEATAPAPTLTPPPRRSEPREHRERRDRPPHSPRGGKGRSGPDPSGPQRPAAPQAGAPRPEREAAPEKPAAPAEPGSPQPPGSGRRRRRRRGRRNPPQAP